MPNATPWKTLTELRVSQSGQSIDAIQTFQHIASDTVVRVVVKRDFYDEQSSGRVDAFDPAKRGWNPIHSLPISALSVHATRNTTSNAAIAPSVVAQIEQDILLLLREPATILAAAMPWAD